MKDAKILLYFAFVLFFLGTFWTPSFPADSPWYHRFNLVSAGLACYIGSMIF